MEEDEFQTKVVSFVALNKELLRLEQETENEEMQQLIEGSSSSQLQRMGEALLRLRLADETDGSSVFRSSLNGNLIVTLQGPKHTLPSHNFGPGLHLLSLHLSSSPFISLHLPSSLFISLHLSSSVLISRQRKVLTLGL